MKNALAFAAAAGFILSASYGFTAGAATLAASSVTTIAATNNGPDQKDDFNGATTVSQFEALLHPSYPGDYDHAEY
jgi:hypothetical protein